MSTYPDFALAKLSELLLEQVLHEENTPTSLPVITIASADRVLNDPNYRDLCTNRLLEIALYLENYRGTRRIFIP